MLSSLLAVFLTCVVPFAAFNIEEFREFNCTQIKILFSRHSLSNQSIVKYVVEGIH
jgi:hypothetical protein